MTVELDSHSQEPVSRSPYNRFMYALKAPESKRQYPKRLEVFHFFAYLLGLPSLRPCISCTICRPTILPCVVPLPPIQCVAYRMILELQVVFFPLHEHRVHSCMPCLIPWSSINMINHSKRLAKKLSWNLCLSV